MRSFPLRLRGLIVLGGILGLLVFGSAGALAVTISRGKTSQRGLVRVYVMKPHTVTGLTIELRTRCTDHKRPDITPGFVAPFRHRQDASGRLSDSYDIVGRDVGTGVRFRRTTGGTTTPSPQRRLATPTRRPTNRAQEGSPLVEVLPVQMCEMTPSQQLSPT